MKPMTIFLISILVTIALLLISFFVLLPWMNMIVGEAGGFELFLAVIFIPYVLLVYLVIDSICNKNK